MNTPDLGSCDKVSRESHLFSALEWRCIGPHRGGRVVAVAGDPDKTATFYFGACTGGVWKTTDAGTYWENISDGYLNSAAVGAIAVSDSDPNVIYIGTGEACIRGNVSHGDGVYKSTDAGRTWSHLGLDDTRHISRIRIHPENPDIVYVAALGHAFGPNEERGVFRSKDGGSTWEKILYNHPQSGAIDLSMDITNPRTLYAAFWEVIRKPWGLDSGGPNSGLFRTNDGGDTWENITNNPGLPDGLKGRIGVSVSAAQPNRVYALVEAIDGGLFRSDDWGDTWSCVSEDRNLRQRPWYYMHIFADPKDGDTVWILNLDAHKSVDGGRTFVSIGTPHGDNHDLWIDPRNSQRMIEGNDGGACISFNGGETWSTILNQPTAQFYHLTTDSQFPYRVYGTQQDNSAISVPSRTYKGAIPYRECYPVGSSESGYIAVRPDNPNIVYSGAIGSAPGGGGPLLRYDCATGQTRIITVWPEVYAGWGPKDIKYRFQWTYPIVLSPHDPNILYATGNKVFRSTDEGTNWEAISPDLTRDDKSKQEASGGPITHDTTGAEHYCTIFSFVESQHQRGVFWAGSDDGLVHVSKDDGSTWADVTPPDMPEWTTISMIEVSPHDPGTAYLAGWRYKLDDYNPYLYKTNDFGQSWISISDGIPDHDFLRCIREDPSRRGLLYAGTESGIYVSFNDGGSWQSLRLNLPVVPIHDLQVKNDDLVAATHGRSFWILDDLTILHQLTDTILDTPIHLFVPRDSYRSSGQVGGGNPPSPGNNYRLGMGLELGWRQIKSPNGKNVRQFLDAGQDSPSGISISYYLAKEPVGEVTIEIMDAGANVINRYSSSNTVESDIDFQVPTEIGMNRFVWNMRYEDAVKVPGDATTERLLEGPLAAPGRHSVKLTAEGQSFVETFQILADPRVSASQADLDSQLAFLLKIKDKQSETHLAINRLRSIRNQITEWKLRTRGLESEQTISTASEKLLKSLAAIEDELIQTKAIGARWDTLNFPSKLNSKLAALPSVVRSADSVPTKQSYEVYEKLSCEIDQQLKILKEVEGKDLVAFNELLSETSVPGIVPHQ